jgi:cell division protein ZapA
MPQVAVVINGKTYRMACDEGQEQHLLSLAKRFDSYVTQLKESFGEIGDQRLTVMAGVMITDELVELQKKLRGLDAELASLRQTRDDALDNNQTREKDIAVVLDVAAARIEQLNTRLTAPAKASTD